MAPDGGAVAVGSGVDKRGPAVGGLKATGDNDGRFVIVNKSGAAVGRRVCPIAGRLVGLRVAIPGLITGMLVGNCVGDGTGRADGAFVNGSTGGVVGARVGGFVGARVGDFVVGGLDGSSVGFRVGESVGFLMGEADGLRVGDLVVGETVKGRIVGNGAGLTLGALVSAAKEHRIELALAKPFEGGSAAN
jgi:hypothetical protein